MYSPPIYGWVIPEGSILCCKSLTTKVQTFIYYSIRFIIDEVLVLCIHIKNIIFYRRKSLKYNLKLIYLIINKNNKNTIEYTVFDKVKVT